MNPSIKAERPPAVPPSLYRPMGSVALVAALGVAMLGALYSGDTTPGRNGLALRPILGVLARRLRR